MEQKNYLKLLWVGGFILFAAVSCWATAESLHLLLSTWPLAMCWIVTIGFFIIASLGTKMIVDSMNKNIYLEKRGARLIGGIIIVIVFWLVCSMPTNTHTFFYRTVISDKVNTDINTTAGYLEQIKHNTNNKNQAELQINKLNNDVDILKGELKAEIQNEANPGFGPKSKEILRKFADVLHCEQIEPLSYKGVSKQQRDQLIDAYSSKIEILRKSREDAIRKHIMTPNPDIVKLVNTELKNLRLTQQYIENKTIDINKAEDIKKVCDQLNNDYNIIKQNSDFVNFHSDEDKKNYTADNPITKVKRMISVFDVWKDYFAGEYAGHGFMFWIIISILVDIAAFIFFDLAFKKRDF